MTTGSQTTKNQAPRGVISWVVNRRLSVKLPVLMVGLALIATSFIAFSSYQTSRTILFERMGNTFEATIHAKENALESWFSSIETEIATQATNPTVKSALTLFSLAFRQLGDTAQQQLQDGYIHNNPHPLGEKQMLDASEMELQYDRNHAKFHLYFRKLQVSAGYYDVFLVDKSGSVIYSVFKELDFATNLESGEWKDSGLARAFRAAMEGEDGIVHFEDFSPYAPSHGAPAAFFSYQIKDGTGKPAGALIYQAPVDALNGIMQQAAGLGETGETFVMGVDGVRRSESRFGIDHGAVGEEMPQRIADLAEREEIRMEQFVADDGFDVLISTTHFLHDAVDWVIVTEQHQDEAFAAITGLRNRMVVFLIGSAVGIALLGGVASRLLTRPFDRIGKAVDALADDNLEAVIPFTERTEEFGQLARNLSHFQNQLLEARTQQERRLQHAAEQRRVVEGLTAAVSELNSGNLTATIQQSFPPEYEELRQAFNNALSQLDMVIGSLVVSAEEIDGNSRGIEGSTNALSDRTVEQAANLEETAAAITQLSASVKNTADAAADADTVMTRAQEDANTSREVVRTAMQAMERISVSSQQITQVTEVIETLSFQTNLLALNAGVEAARAGDAGRGFAVVASEVRALALRSSEAAKEINDLIRESAENVASGVDVVEKVGASFDGLQNDMVRVSNSVTQIATAAREQSIGLEAITEAVNQLDGMTQKNAGMATEVHGAGKTLASEAGKLIDLSRAFTVSGDGITTGQPISHTVPEPANDPGTDHEAKQKEPEQPQPHDPEPVQTAPQKQAQAVNAAPLPPEDDLDSGWADF